MKQQCALVLAALLSAVVLAQQPPSDRFQRIAGRIVEAFNAKNFTGMENDFSHAMLEAVPLGKLAQVSRDLKTQFGHIQKLDPPHFPAPNIALFTVSFERGAFDMIFTLDGQDKIIGLRFAPHIPVASAPARNAVRLSVPFTGAWLVA